MDAEQAKRHALDIAKGLAEAYPDATCALNFSNPLELLIATILSAQCTDVRVNLVTKDLFQRYRSAEDYATAPLADLEKAIQSTGFFRNKAKNIQACCQRLIADFDGEVPPQMEELVHLPGVGRKTANVVLGTAFDIASGVVVDTHVTRLSNRMGLTSHEPAEKIEQDLMALLPKEEWIDFSHRMIHHGRQVCQARKALCDLCTLLPLCPQIGVNGNGPPAGKKANSGASSGKPVRKSAATRSAATKSAATKSAATQANSKAAAKTRTAKSSAKAAVKSVAKASVKKSTTASSRGKAKPISLAKKRSRKS